MRFKITHRTNFFYGEQVPLCHNVVRLRPRETAWQTCLSHELIVAPLASEMREWTDFFGNHVTWISVQEPHSSLKITTTSEVEVTASEPDPMLTGPAWDAVPDMLNAGVDGAALAAREYTFESPHAAGHPELLDYARPSFSPGTPLATAVYDLTQRINHDFTFDTLATTVGTPSLEVLHSRRGVCQDFAHLQIGCLRSLGLAARYVSGYVLTRPPAGRPRLVGADASHAWISVFVPGIGWLDYDPTNGRMPSGEHITIGWGRDYDDVSPVKGIITGGHGQALSYAVDVEPITAPAPVAPTMVDAGFVVPAQSKVAGLSATASR